MNSISQTQPTVRRQAERAAFSALQTAVRDAWEDTQYQIGERDYDPRIVQTLFGQLLYHNVLNRVYLLGQEYPGIEVRLAPNKTNSAHHIVVTISHWIITVSAVRNREARPRDAHFRTSYAQQWSWDIDENDNFVTIPPLSGGSGTAIYIHLLHGPLEERRRELGFVLIAQPNASGEYVTSPVPLETYLNDTFGPVTLDEEIIEEEFPDLKLHQAVDHPVH